MKNLPTRQFISDVKTIIDSARTSAVRSVDFHRVMMYWQIGERIVEEEQQGKIRADYAHACCTIWLSN